VHQVSLAQADATIKEERVVAVLGVVGHLPGGRTGQLVGLALDKVLEGEGAIQITGVLEGTLHLHVALHRPRGLHHDTGRGGGRRPAAGRGGGGRRRGGRRGDAGRAIEGAGRYGRRGRPLCRRRRGAAPAANPQGHCRRLTVGPLAEQFDQTPQVFLVDPV